MSVCIAGISLQDRTIVSVSDRMISTALGEVTAENAAVKQGFVHKNWFVMFSGNDVGCVGPIIRATSRALDNAIEYSPDDIRAALITAYNDERKARAVSEHLAIYGLDMPTFFAEGFSKFGQPRFEELCKRIDRVLLDVDFLVAGFDGGGSAHIFTVDAGNPADYDLTGYWAIGSGKRLALAALGARNQGFLRSTSETVYNLCAARFTAVGAHGVGREETILAIQKKDQQVYVAPLEVVRDVRIQWEAHARTTPQRAVDAINAWLTPAPPEIIEGPPPLELQPPEEPPAV